jgi:hypothetical protein
LAYCVHGGRTAQWLQTKSLTIGLASLTSCLPPVKWAVWPGNVYLSRFPREELIASGHCYSTTPVSPQGGFLPSSFLPDLSWAEHKPNVQGTDMQGQVHATQACLLLPGSSTLQTIATSVLDPHPKLGPSYPQTKNSLHSKSMLMSCWPAHLLNRSPTADLTNNPARPAASDPWGCGWGEGAKLSLKFHFKLMRPCSWLTHSTYSPVHSSNTQAQERGPAFRSGWRGVGVTKETLQPSLLWPQLKANHTQAAPASGGSLRRFTVRQ